MVLPKKRVLFPATVTAAPSITHYSACILGSPKSSPNLPQKSLLRLHITSPQRPRGAQQSSFAKHWTDEQAGPDSRAPASRFPRCSLERESRRKAAPRAVGGDLGISRLEGLTNNAGESGLGDDRPRPRQDMPPAAHHALGSDREAPRGLWRREKSQQPQGHCSAVPAGSRTRRTRARRGPRLSAARCHDATAEVFAAPVGKKKKLSWGQ